MNDKGEKLLRKYIFHNQIIISHIIDVAETYLQNAYNNEEELESDMQSALKRISKLIEIETFATHSRDFSRELVATYVT